jgi:hypothetical protein
MIQAQICRDGKHQMGLAEAREKHLETLRQEWVSEIEPGLSNMGVSRERQAFIRGRVVEALPPARPGDRGVVQPSQGSPRERTGRGRGLDA